MDDQNKRLIERLLTRIEEGPQSDNDQYWDAYRKRRPYPPVLAAEIERVEEALGFYLPPLFKEMYQSIGDGGFGPGLMRLNPPRSAWNDALNLDSIVFTYQELRRAYVEHASEYWPEGIIIITDWGCNIYSCLDCLGEPEYPILRKDYNHSHDAFYRESPSLAQWLEAWLDERSLSDMDVEAAEKLTFPAPERLT